MRERLKEQNEERFDLFIERLLNLLMDEYIEEEKIMEELLS